MSIHQIKHIVSIPFVQGFPVDIFNIIRTVYGVPIIVITIIRTRHRHLNFIILEMRSVINSRKEFLCFLKNICTIYTGLVSLLTKNIVIINIHYYLEPIIHSFHNKVHYQLVLIKLCHKIYD